MTLLVLFIHRESGAAGRLLETVIRKAFPDIGQQVCRTPDELDASLQKSESLEKRKIHILLADTPERLMQLTGLSDGFDDKKVLLILPDADKNTVSMGHKLRPRYVTSQEQGFENLCAVLKKMIDSTQPKGDKGGKESNTDG